MALDLWTSSHQDLCNYPEQLSCQPNFYFFYGHDLIEEHALNEKACIQVLRFLIAKVDIEIEELENELLLLQNELALAEHEEWPRIYCNAMQKKINYLDASLECVKNDGVDNLDVRLVFQSRPSEKLHDIVKVLLKYHYSEEYWQPSNTNAEDSSPGSSGYPMQKKILEGIFVDHVQNNITEDHSSACKDGRTTDSLIHQEKNRAVILSKKALVKPPNSSDRCKFSYCRKIKSLCKSGGEFTGSDNVTRQQLACADELHSSGESKGIQKKEKPANGIAKDGSKGSLRIPTGFNGRKKRPRMGLGASEMDNDKDFDLDQRLCEFVMKSGLKDMSTELAVALNEEIIPGRVITDMKCTRKRPLQVQKPSGDCTSKGLSAAEEKNPSLLVKDPDEGLSCPEHSALSSLLLMQTTSDLEKFNLPLVGQGKPEAEALRSIMAANMSKSKRALLPKRKNQRRNEIGSEGLSDREPVTHFVEDVSDNSAAKKQKKQPKCIKIIHTGSSTQSKNAEIREKQGNLLKCEAEDHAVHQEHKCYDTLQKRIEVSAKPPKPKGSAIEIDLSGSDGVTLEIGENNYLQSCSCVDSFTESSSLLPSAFLDLDVSTILSSASLDLNKLTVIDLRKIAKQQKLKKYHKLPKHALLEVILQKMEGKEI